MTVVRSLAIAVFVLHVASAGAVPYPADLAMPAYVLPDPLVAADGRRIATAAAWNAVRRPELLELFRAHVYGRVPATPWTSRVTIGRTDPAAMAGAATLKEVRITIAARGRELAFNLVLFVPNKAPRPVPAFLLICNRGPANIDPTRAKKSEFWPAEQLVARGFAAAAFLHREVDPDAPDGYARGVRALLDESPRPPDAWGAVGAWAWGASRVMDYLEADREIDPRRVAVIGHSRGGKAALWAGAQDERFGLVVSNDSGCTGASLARRRFEGRESILAINGNFPHWFAETYKTYDGCEEDLPVDQHELIALTAPRPVAVGSAADDLWADPRGEFLAVVHAAPVYRLLGSAGLSTTLMPAEGMPLHGDRVHYHLAAGGHGLTLADWNHYMDFADRAWAPVGRSR